MTTDKTFELENTIFELGELEITDIDELVDVASEWVKDRDTGEVVHSELASVRERMESTLNSNDYRYYVIRDEGHKAIGCAAIREPEAAMQEYKTSPSINSRELVNVFLSGDYRGKGLGYKLMEFLFIKSKELGYEEVIWNSGPRYRYSAWSFYTKLVGKPFALARDFYGKGGDAPIWRKTI